MLCAFPIFTRFSFFYFQTHYLSSMPGISESKALEGRKKKQTKQTNCRAASSVLQSLQAQEPSPKVTTNRPHGYRGWSPTYLWALLQSPSVAVIRLPAPCHSCLHIWLRQSPCRQTKGWGCVGPAKAGGGSVLVPLGLGDSRPPPARLPPRSPSAPGLEAARSDLHPSLARLLCSRTPAAPCCLQTLPPSPPPPPFSPPFPHPPPHSSLVATTVPPT